jgi:hypothetical protein
LKNAAIDHGHAKERPIGILSGLTEVLESGMLCRVLDEYRPQLLGDQTGQPFADAHLHQADALRPEPDRGRQHQRRAIEPPLDQIHDVGQRFGWIAAA